MQASIANMEITKVVQEGEKKEDHLHAVWLAFAAGTAALVACLQRAALASLVEQWRVWVFLALNLLLLAILFTSPTCTTFLDTCSASSDPASRESNTEVQHHKINNASRMGRKQCRRRTVSANEDHGGDRLKSAKSPSGGSGRVDEREGVHEDDEAAKAVQQLSKEELNERVEAFIAMFRQQLVSDAKDRSRFRYSARARQHFA